MTVKGIVKDFYSIYMRGKIIFEVEKYIPVKNKKVKFSCLLQTGEFFFTEIDGRIKNMCPIFFYRLNFKRRKGKEMIRKIFLYTGVILILTAVIFYIWAGSILAQKEEIFTVVSAKEISYGTTIENIETARQYLKIIEVPQYLLAENSYNAKAIIKENRHIPPVIQNIKNAILGEGEKEADVIAEQLLSQFIGNVFTVNVPRNQQITKNMVTSLENYKANGIGLYSFLVRKECVGGGEIKNGYVVDIWYNVENEAPGIILRNVKIAKVSDAGEYYLVSVYFSAEEISALETVAKKGKIFLVRVQ